jgi:hypothetical protein
MKNKIKDDLQFMFETYAVFYSLRRDHLMKTFEIKYIRKMEELGLVMHEFLIENKTDLTAYTTTFPVFSLEIEECKEMLRNHLSMKLNQLFNLNIPYESCALINYPNYKLVMI